MHPALAKALQKIAVPDLVTRLTEGLSPGQLSTLLLAVFAHKTKTPAQLLSDFGGNRFVQPATTDPLALRRQTLAMLESSQAQGFKPLELSPLSPLGCVASYGKINQNQVLSALRNCEVSSDPSNLLALVLAQTWKTQPQPEIHYCCSQRVIRTQQLTSPEFKAHFELFAAASLLDGPTPESLAQGVLKHLLLQQQLYSQAGIKQVEFQLQVQKLGHEVYPALAQHLKAETQLNIREVLPGQGSYYKTLRVMSFDSQNNLNLGDMGLVDWPAQLVSQKRLSLVISGIGVERLLPPTI